MPIEREQLNRPEPHLEAVMSDIAVIRMSFETLALFPPGDPICEEIREMVNDARNNLIQKFRHIATLTPRELTPYFHTSDDGFRDFAIALKSKGYPRRNLDSMLKTDVFCSGASAENHRDCSEVLYLYELNQPISTAVLNSLPSLEVYQIFVADILQAVEEPANYASKYHFDRQVFQKIAAFLFCHYAGTDPFFYGGGDPGSGTGSGVPGVRFRRREPGRERKPFPNCWIKGQTKKEPKMKTIMCVLLAFAALPICASGQNRVPRVFPDLETKVAAILPTEEEQAFLQIPWRLNVMQARAESARTGKPMFVWEMNGHPLGHT